MAPKSGNALPPRPMEPMTLIDPRDLSADDIDSIEKVSLRLAFQAIVQFAHQSWAIFRSSPDDQQDIAEDITREAMDSLAGFPIRMRLFGTLDYKRARWLPTPRGLVPQALFVDAKAEKEDTRARLQLSQVSMPVSYRAESGDVVELEPGLPAFMPFIFEGEEIQAITTVLLAHYSYTGEATGAKQLMNCRLIALPHARLKERYCPTPEDHIWITGPHSPARQEDPRLRLSFKRLRERCPWRLQTISWDAAGVSRFEWLDVAADGTASGIHVPVEQRLPTPFIQTGPQHGQGE